MAEEDTPPPVGTDVPDRAIVWRRVQELMEITHAHSLLTVATSVLAERLGREIGTIIKTAGLNDSDLMGVVKRVQEARTRLIDTIGGLKSNDQ